jgi:hypothetical protein
LSYGRAATVTSLLASTYAGINSAQVAAYDLSVGSNGAYVGGDVFCGHLIVAPAGAGTVEVRGFGAIATYGTQGYTTNDGNPTKFQTGGATIQVIAGSAGVQLTSASSAWAAISDYRAKNVAGPFTTSGEVIDAVPVHLAALKETPDKTKAMFLAHEVQAAVPYAVHGEKDGEEMQTVETTDPLIPIMWAELRGLRERVAALEAHLVL